MGKILYIVLALLAVGLIYSKLSNMGFHSRCANEYKFERGTAEHEMCVSKLTTGQRMVIRQ